MKRRKPYAPIFSRMAASPVVRSRSFATHMSACGLRTMLSTMSSTISSTRSTSNDWPRPMSPWR